MRFLKRTLRIAPCLACLIVRDITIAVETLCNWMMMMMMMMMMMPNSAPLEDSKGKKCFINPKLNVTVRKANDVVNTH